MSRLTDFPRGTAADTEGRTLADLWAFSDDQLEEVHDFIRWMFPVREPSRFHPDAPLLTDADIAEFRGDPALRDNLARSFAVFLAFLGLQHADGPVGPAPDFDRKSEVWRRPNHNWLRITRVLTSTRLLVGLEREGRAFDEALRRIRDGGVSEIEADTFRYRESAAGVHPVGAN